MSRTARSCPFCRRTFVRLADHLVHSHSDLSEDLQDTVRRRERNRVKAATPFSVDINYLRALVGYEKGNVIAKFLLDSSLAVFQQDYEAQDSYTTKMVDRRMIPGPEPCRRGTQTDDRYRRHMPSTSARRASSSSAESGTAGNDERRNRRPESRPHSDSPPSDPARHRNGNRRVLAHTKRLPSTRRATRYSSSPEYQHARKRRRGSTPEYPRKRSRHERPPRRETSADGRGPSLVENAVRENDISPRRVVSEFPDGRTGREDDSPSLVENAVRENDISPRRVVSEFPDGRTGREDDSPSRVENAVRENDTSPRSERTQSANVDISPIATCSASNPTPRGNSSARRFVTRPQAESTPVRSTHLNAARLESPSTSHSQVESSPNLNHASLSRPVRSCRKDLAASGCLDTPIDSPEDDTSYIPQSSSPSLASSPSSAGHQQAAELETAPTTVPRAQLSATVGPGSKLEFKKRYKRARMYVSPMLRRKLVSSGNGPLAELSKYLQATQVDPLGRRRGKDPVTNTLSTAAKIMTYCAPDNDICRFQWHHLDAAKITCLINTLRDQIGLSAAYIKNFLSAIRDMVQCFPDHTQQFSVTGMLKRLQQANSRKISKDHSQRQVDSLFIDPSETDHLYICYNEVYKSVKIVALDVVAASAVRKLSVQELLLMNSFFLLHNTILGNRPGVFANMRVSTYRRVAERPPMADSDNQKIYALPTADHKTGACFLANMFMDQSVWEMLVAYVRHIRPVPDARGPDADVLFLSSSNRAIYNPSSDLKKLVSKFDPDLGKDASASHYRKLVTTLAERDLSESDYRIINGMLTHSDAVANRHYKKASVNRMPGVLGLPLMSRLYSNCVRNVGGQSSRTHGFPILDTEVLETVPKPEEEVKVFLRHCDEAMKYRQTSKSSRGSDSPTTQDEESPLQANAGEQTAAAESPLQQAPEFDAAREVDSVATETPAIESEAHSTEDTQRGAGTALLRHLKRKLLSKKKQNKSAPKKKTKAAPKKKTKPAPNKLKSRKAKLEPGTEAISNEAKRQVKSIFLKYFAPSFTVDSSTAIGTEFRRLVEERQLQIDCPLWEPIRRRLNDLAIYHKEQLRGMYVLKEIRKMNEPDYSSNNIGAILSRKGWITANQFKTTLSMAKTDKRAWAISKHGASAKPSAIVSDTMHSLIESQQYPYVKLDGTRTLVASKPIPKGTFVCDIHGTVISRQDGMERVAILYRGKPKQINRVIFFELDEIELAMDLNENCKCHPTIKVKGHALRKSSNSGVLRTQACRRRGKIHLLAYANRHIDTGCILTFKPPKHGPGNV